MFHMMQIILIILNPDNAGLYFKLGIALQENKQLDDAISSYKKALQITEGLSFLS